MAENSVIISAEEEAKLLKPIDEYVEKIQKKIDALRVDGSDKVNDLKNQIAIAKENKNLSKAQRDKIIENSKKELENAKKVEADNKEEIKKILPHREPMLLVDEVELIDGKAFGKCHIRGDEYFLQGHFPGNPIVPGVIQCEMLAQSACVLLADGASEGMTPVFTSLDKVKFRGMVKPGDTLETECELVRQRGMFYFAKGTGRVNGKVCVSAEFSFALVKA